MFARIFTIIALLAGFVPSVSAQQCRTVYNTQTGKLLERDCSTFQNANRSQTTLTVGQIFLLDSRVQYSHPDHLLKGCSDEEARNLLLRQVLTLTFHGAANGWAEIDDRSGTNNGSRIGFARGINTALATQCVRVVARPVQQELVVTTQVAQIGQVLSSERKRPCVKIDGINYGMLTDAECAVIVPRGARAQEQLTAPAYCTINYTEEQVPKTKNVVNPSRNFSYCNELKDRLNRKEININDL